MWKLETARVSRAGVTARRWNYGTAACNCGVRAKDVQFQFDIASKGGGRTDILLTIGADDLPRILEEMVETMPNGEELLLQALAHGVEHRRAAANKRRATANGIIERLNAARTKIARMNELSTELWIEKPNGEDKREGELKDLATSLTNPDLLHIEIVVNHLGDAE